MAREIDEVYRGFFEGIYDPIFVADPDTRRLVDCNKKALEMLGMDKSEILCMRADQLHPEDVREDVMEIFKKQAKGEGIVYESYLLARNGKKIPISISSSLLNIQDKKYLIGVFRDMTERKESEKRLQDSEERFRLMAENIPMAIQGYDLTGKVFYWNKKSEELYGYTSNEAIGSDLSDLIIPEEMISRYRQSLESAERMNASGEFAPPCKLSLTRKDGSKVLVYSTHLLIYRGDVPELYCIDVDITDMERTKKELEEREAMIQGIASAAPVGIATAIHRKIQWMNGYFLDILGYTMDEIKGIDTKMIYKSDEDYEYVGKVLYDELREKGRKGKRRYLFKM